MCVLARGFDSSVVVSNIAYKMGKLKKSQPKSVDKLSKPSLATIVKPKLKGPTPLPKEKPVNVVVAVANKKVPALKRKQKKPKNSSGPIIQKKHVKRDEKKKKLALKFELMLNQRKEEKQKLKKEKLNKKCGVVGKMGALKDALPSLDDLLKLKPTEIKTGVPQYEDIKVQSQNKAKQKVVSLKINKKSMKEKRLAAADEGLAKRYDHLHKLMNDKSFRRNPRTVIANHIKNTRLMEESNKTL